MESFSFGLTTKPCHAERDVNNTTILNTLGEKSPANLRGFFSFLTGGLDGTRTRDPMRDRHVF